MDWRAKYKSNVWKYYLYTIFANPVFVAPILTIFLLARGLSFTQVMFLEALFAAAVFLLEVPTGAVADLIGRKTSLIMGSLFYIVSLFIYAAGHSFLAFAIAEGLFAVGASLKSGADSAFIYDSLKSVRKEGEFKKVEGAALSYGFAFAAVAMLFAGFLADVDLALPFYACIGLFTVALVASLVMYEPQHHKKVKITARRYFGRIKEGLELSAKHRKIRWLMLFGALVSALGIGGFWLYQPYMQQNGFPLKWFGVAFFTFNIIAFLASKFAHRIEKKIGELASLALMPLTMIIAFVLMAAFNPIFGFMFIWFHQFQRGFSKPIISGYMHEHIESEHRATVISVNGMVSRLATVPALPLLGYAVDLLSLSTAMWLAAGSIVVLAGLLFWFRPKVLDS